MLQYSNYIKELLIMTSQTLVLPKDIDESTLNFIHENGVNYLKETVISLAVIKKNALLLLSYLILVITFMISKIIPYCIDYYQTLEKSQFQTLEQSALYIIIPLALFILYYSVIILNIIKFSIPVEGYTAYFEPEPYMNKDYYVQDDEFKALNCSMLHFLKYRRCIKLQKDIEENHKLLQHRYSAFKKALNMTLIAPLLVKLFSCP